VQAYNRNTSSAIPLWLNYGVGNTILGGNVGIGTTGPGATLHVSTSGSASAWQGLFLQPSLSSGNFTQLILGQSTASNASGTITYNYNSGTPGSSYMSLGLYGGATYALNVTGGGNVGIGITSPTGKLNVVGSGGVGQGLEFDNYEIKFRGDGYAHYSLFNTNGVFSINNTSGAATTGTAGTNLLTILSGGNVGIGLTGPSSTLTVGGNPPVAGEIAAVGASGGIALALSDNVNSSLYVRTASGGAVIGTDGGGNLKFATNGNAASNAAMTILASGYVGINQTNPTARLDVVTGGSGGAGALIAQFGSLISPRIRLYDENASSSLGPILNFNAGNVSQITGAGNIALMPTGNVGINTTGPGYKLEVNGTMNVDSILYNTGMTNYAADWYVCQHGNGLYYGASCAASDRRLKTNIEPIGFALDNVIKLRGVFFDWKDKAKQKVQGRQIGLIAQEVEPIYPQVVITNSDGLKSLKYEGLIAPLIEAIKELKAANDNEAAEIKALRADIEQLKVARH
jgi:hypothetical protein